MAYTYEILKTKATEQNGETVLLLVTHTPAGVPTVHYDWYVFRHYPKKTLAFYYQGKHKIDTTPVIGDIRKPAMQVTPEDGKGTAIGLAKNAVMMHLAETYVDDAEKIVETIFEPSNLIALRMLLIANVGRKEITAIKDNTHCTNLQADLLDLLARNPERKPPAVDPYPDETRS